MITTITYYPDLGVSINDIAINWGTDRFIIRQLLANQHKESNSITDLSEFHNGSNEYNIIQRRDIYENYQGHDNYFFFNYDKDDTLKEIEIHNGMEISVIGTKLSFDKDFQENVSLLKNISTDNRQVSNGEHFFKDLKLTIADNESMGGEDSVLSYFYCANNVDHLCN
ncbi:hypothetical protein [Ferruginibacter sp.]|nr:hypothetical protein [Ferruginibacter sp.]